MGGRRKETIEGHAAFGGASAGMNRENGGRKGRRKGGREGGATKVEEKV